MTIPLEKLLDVKTIVTHASCPDGTASAMILRDVMPKAQVLFVQYGTPEHEHLEAKEKMLFCDFIPPAKRAQEFVDAGSIVLDHHRTARSVVDMFGELGVFADENDEPGVSGAVLAFREVWKPIAYRGGLRPAHHFIEGANHATIEQFATLAGVRDTWQKHSSSWQRACAQAEVLKFYPSSEWLEHGPGLIFEKERLKDRMALGEMLLKKRSDANVEMIQRMQTYITDKSVAVGIVPTLATSDISEAIPHLDFLIGFAYRVQGGQQTLTLSTRSRGKFDCARFCTFYGGGGHTNAAGCSFPIAPDALQPYTYIEQLINAYERTL